VTRGGAHDSGVPLGRELVALAESAMSLDPAAIDAARQTLLLAAGPEVLVDAAAVIGNFDRMNRIADAIGLPLDGPVDAISSDIQDELSLREYASSAHTPRLSRLGRAGGALLRGAILPLALRIVHLMRKLRSRS
jgi:hypothetical protein